MKVLRYVLLALLLIVVVVVVGGFVFYWDTTRGPLPQTTGSLTVAGLQAQVEILRDEAGIPNIYASNTHDLFFAQGYSQAQDRWWQMEFFRHVASGSIEELTGKTDSLVGTDIFIRTVGWRRAAEKDVTNLSDEAHADLQAFADGVNAYITSRPADKLALEYRVLGLTGVRIPIQPWTIVDSLAWGKVMAWNLTDSYSRELVRQDLIKAVGEDMMLQYTPPYQYGDNEAPTIVHEDDLPVSDSTLTNPTLESSRTDSSFSTVMAGGVQAGASIAGMVSAAQNDGIGSNDWVATRSMTASGLAMLANDMHLDVQEPGIWYLVGLHCLPVTDDCPFDVVGFALPPTPGIISGHNANIAWGLTNVGADVQDLYSLQWDPQDPTRYFWNGEWQSADIVSETINYGDGAAPLTIQVRVTHLGPVINDNKIDDGSGEVMGFNTQDPLVLRWTGYEPGHQFNAILELNQAKDWEGFRAALSQFEIPSQNFVFADTLGNIGYQTPGLMPIRPAGVDGLTPHEVAGDADVWQGFIPFEDMPRILNPPRNYIATGNNAVVPMAYYDQLAEKIGGDRNYLLSFDWAYGQRAARIEQLIQERSPNTVDTFQDIQRDNKDLTAERIVPHLNDLQLESGSVQESRDFLTSWDFAMNADSSQAALYAYFAKHLVADLFNDQLPDSIRASNRETYAASLLMDDPNNAWWDDVTTTDKTETRDDILLKALTEAVDDIAAKLGNNPAEWSWGKLHGITYVSNPLGVSGISLIENMVNRTSLGFSGGNDIVNATSWDASSDDFYAHSQPSERIISDLSNFDNSFAVLPSGESGHPYSSHYDDMIETYRTGGYFSLPFSRTQIEQVNKERLVLNPSA